MADEQPIIVIKKKGGHGGHHGGAWKVAYADFVTAMMALFIVLWLMNTSEPIQEAVGGYFRDPLGTAKKTGSAMGGAGNAAPVKKEDMAKLKQDLMKAMEKMAGFDKLKKQIELTLTPEGLQIEMMESPQGTFFENGKAQPTEIMQNLLKVLSVEIGKLPNQITIEGHTDSKPFSDSPLYGNWELSTDRGNAARRLMEISGLRPDQVVQVRGYADQKLRKPQAPEDPSNRRVTLIVQYLKPPAGPPAIVTDGSLPQAGKLAAPAAPASKQPSANTKETKSEK
ncbi:MAG: flagellar motor protein MotB [Acidobacteriaceae bacterium]